MYREGGGGYGGDKGCVSIGSLGKAEGWCIEKNGLAATAKPFV